MHIGASTVYAQAEIARDNANNLFNEVTEAESKCFISFIILWSILRIGIVSVILCLRLPVRFPPLPLATSARRRELKL